MAAIPVSGTIRRMELSTPDNGATWFYTVQMTAKLGDEDVLIVWKTDEALDIPDVDALTGQAQTAVDNYTVTSGAYTVTLT